MSPSPRTPANDPLLALAANFPTPQEADDAWAAIPVEDRRRMAEDRERWELLMATRVIQELLRLYDPYGGSPTVDPAWAVENVTELAGEYLTRAVAERVVEFLHGKGWSGARTLELAPGWTVVMVGAQGARIPSRRMRRTR